MSACRDDGPEPADRSWRIIDPDGLDIAPCRQIQYLLFPLAVHRAHSLSVQRRRSTGARSCWKCLRGAKFCPATPS